MFKKSFIISLIALILSVCASANSETQNLPKETVSQNETESHEVKVSDENQELAVFGIYNKKFYSDIINVLDSMKANAEKSLEKLIALDSVLDKSETSEESDKVETKENEEEIDEEKLRLQVKTFQDFLDQQSHLDENVLELLGLFGFTVENKEI